MSLPFSPIHVSKMKVWTLLGFDYVACKNSFSSSFHLLQSSDKFSCLNLIGLGVDNLSIIGEFWIKWGLSNTANPISDID